jgi:outer membrane protein OmpA-like peptidoglycan-associated protein
MRRVFAVIACLILAACGGGPRVSNYGPLTAPPPASAEEMHPYQEPEKPAYEAGRLPQVASAGPVRTAMIGSYMDNQESELRRAVHGMPVLVGRPGDDIVLHLRSDDYFRAGSFDVSDEGQRILWAIAPVLRRYDSTKIFIDGYTDTTGSADENLANSRKRAYAVGGVLVKDGVPLSRLQATGYGEQNLKIQTGDHKNEPRNRRIEIRISARASG